MHPKKNPYDEKRKFIMDDLSINIIIVSTNLLKAFYN